MSLGDVRAELGELEMMVFEQHQTAVAMHEFVSGELIPQLTRLAAEAANSPDAAYILQRAPVTQDALFGALDALALLHGAIGVWIGHL